MPDRRRINLATLLMLLVLAAGFGLRIQQWNRFEVPDEAQLAEMTLSLHDDPFPGGDYPGYPGYPPLFIYLNFILSWLYQKALLFLGVIHFPSEFVHSGLGYSFILKAGRIVSSLAGTALIALVYKMTRDFASRQAALLASLLIAVNSLLVFDAHIFKPDTLNALLLTACLYFALRYDREPSQRRLFGASFFFGLAVAAKYNSVVEILLLVAIVVIARRRGLGTRLWQSIGLAFAAMGIGFFMAAPNWLVHPLANIRQAYSFVHYHYSGFRFYSKNVAYGSYFKMLVDGFGPVLFIFLVAGLALIAWKRRRTDILVAAFIMVYILLLGNTAYFGARVLLPLLPACAWIIARTLFADIPGLLGRRRKAALAYRCIAWTLLAAVAVTAAAADVRRFNLLDTATTYSQSVQYRIQHIGYDYALGRENLTPAFRGDVGFSDLTSIPEKWFRGPGALRFLSSGLLAKYIQENPVNPFVQSRLRRRLARYAPFHLISKPRFSSFDDDITFWYHRPAWVTLLNRDRPYPRLPRVFVLPPDEFPSDTIFLPLQNFEKSPFFGRIERGIWTKKIFSSRRIARFRFQVLQPAAPSMLYLGINGRSEKFWLDQANRIRSIVVAGVKPKALHHGYVYALEMAYDQDLPPPHFVFAAEYETPPESGEEAGLFEGPVAEAVPDLFAAGEPPAWCRLFYERTGIDPLLYRFIQTERLYQNWNQESEDKDLGCYALEPGRYIVRVSGQKIVESLPQRPNLQVIRTFPGREKQAEGTFTFSLAEMEKGLGRTISAETLTFCYFRIAGQRQSNFLVNKLTIEPDFLAYVNEYWIKKTHIAE